MQIADFHQKNENKHSGDSKFEPSNELNLDTLAYVSLIDTKLYPISVRQLLTYYYLKKNFKLNLFFVFRCLVVHLVW